MFYKLFIFFCRLKSHLLLFFWYRFQMRKDIKYLIKTQKFLDSINRCDCSYNDYLDQFFHGSYYTKSLPFKGLHK